MTNQSGCRRVLITGGTSSIGAAIAAHLANNGDQIVITGRNTERGNVIANATGAKFIQGDIREDGTIDTVVKDATDWLGGLDALVLNAGVLHTARISETQDADWDTVLETNLIAPFLFARACLPFLAERGGAIVAIASGTSLWTEMELGAYSVSKRALLWLVHMLAVETAPQGITVNAVCPGDTASGMTSVTSETPLRDLGDPAIPPLGRPVLPTDVATAVNFFLNEEAAFCSGASLLVDGGMRAALRAHRVRN